MERDKLLEINGITKQFPGVLALDHVNFELLKGEVHALIGENGAGKSTLMNIILGIYQSDEGTMMYRGKPYRPSSPHDALEKGISMIHQEIRLTPTMSVAENVWIGREDRFTKYGFIQYKEMMKATEMLFQELNISLDPGTITSHLSIANMQLVEIARAVSYDPDVIIMDEPTSSLTQKEIDILYEVIRKLSSKGKGIIFISHKLEELFAVCQRITVFRDGKYIATKKTDEMDKEKLIQMMVGRELKDMYPKEKVEIGNVILEAHHLSRSGYFEDISFQVREGEIVGFCGLIGAGRTEIMQSVFGIDPLDAGELSLHGRPIKNKHTSDAIKNKMAMVTEDRLRRGMIHHLPIKLNISLANMEAYSKMGFIDDKKLDDTAKNMVEFMNVKCASLEQEVGMLSGGNQQKVIIGKWLLTTPDVLILDEPTRGIDVGSKAEIYRIIGDLAKQRKGIIVVSSELQELMAICDRIIVVSHGKITGELERDAFSQEKLMSYAF